MHVAGNKPVDTPEGIAFKTVYCHVWHGLTWYLHYSRMFGNGFEFACFWSQPWFGACSDKSSKITKSTKGPMSISFTNSSPLQPNDILSSQMVDPIVFFVMITIPWSQSPWRTDGWTQCVLPVVWAHANNFWRSWLIYIVYSDCSLPAEAGEGKGLNDSEAQCSTGAPEQTRAFTYLWSQRCCRAVCSAREVKLQQDHGI